MNTNEIAELHQRAMAIAEQAFLSQRQGELDRAFDLNKEAFRLESRAALAAAQAVSLEPTRSVLLRSAATLAFDIRNYREAEKLVAIALGGEPPEPIAEELRDLYEQINLARHLQIRGITLSEDEFQMSLTGNGIGLGVVESSDFFERAEKTRTLVMRTAERKQHRPFRESGPVSKNIRESMPVFISTPRPGSFAVSFRLGVIKAQSELPGTSLAKEVVDDLIDSLEFFAKNDLTGLSGKIQDESYLRNFVSLADALLPDGENVKTVGFTAFRFGKERSVALTRTRIAYGTPFELQKIEAEPVKDATVTVSGILKFADDTKEEKKIKIVEDSGKTYSVSVPEGMLTDIVKPLWNDRVTVTGLKKGKTIQMNRIERAED